MLDDYSRLILKNLASSSSVTEGIFVGAEDPTTGALALIPIEHKEIHEGHHYFIQNYTSIANGATYEFVITTPDTTTLSHFNYKVDVEDDTTFVMTQGVTASGGTTVNPVNNDLNSSNTSTLTWVHTPTSSSGGSIISQQRLGSSLGAVTKIGGEIRNDGEIILRRNTKLSIKITNNAGSAKKVNWTFCWYEVS